METPGYTSAHKERVLSSCCCANNHSASHYHFVCFFSLSYARCTLAELTPRLSPNTVGSANVNGIPTRGRLSGTHRETLVRPSADLELQCVQYNCLSEGVEMNKIPSPYQPSRMCALPLFGKCEWSPDTTSGMCHMTLF